VLLFAQTLNQATKVGTWVTVGAGGVGIAQVAQYFTSAGATPVTLTGPQMAGAQEVVVDMTTNLGGAGTLNTATAAQIIAAIPNAVVGMTYSLRIINHSAGAFAWTLTAGANVTVNGTATINQNTFRDFVVTIATATTVTIQNATAP
jgi:hypothetical protein